MMDTVKTVRESRGVFYAFSDYSTLLALWPLFHYLLWQDVTHEISSHDGEFQAYSKANEAYAKALQQIYMPGDLIWIQVSISPESMTSSLT